MYVQNCAGRLSFLSNEDLFARSTSNVGHDLPKRVNQLLEICCAMLTDTLREEVHEVLRSTRRLFPDGYV